MPCAAPRCIQKVKDNVITRAEVVNDPCEFNDTVANISNLVVVQDGRTVDCPYLRNESPCKRSIPSFVICLTGGQHWAVEVVDCAVVRDIRTGIMNEEC